MALIHSCALSTHAVPMKTGFNFANPPTQHQPVPQVPPHRPTGRAVQKATRGLTAQLTALKKALRLFAKLGDRKSTMISLGAPFPTTPALITHPKLGRRCESPAVGPSQLLARGSDRQGRAGQLPVGSGTFGQQEGTRLAMTHHGV